MEKNKEVRTKKRETRSVLGERTKRETDVSLEQDKCNCTSHCRFLYMLAKKKKKKKKRQVSLYVIFVRRKKIALVLYRKMYVTLHLDFGTCDYNDCRSDPNM